jgi:transposase
MGVKRYELTEAQWRRIEPLLIPAVRARTTGCS